MDLPALFMVERLIECPAHGFLAVLEWDDGECVERGAWWLTPQCRGGLGRCEPPVAEWQDDVAELQSLALVYGHDPYAMATIVLCLLLSECVVERRYE